MFKLFSFFLTLSLLSTLSLTYALPQVVLEAKDLEHNPYFGFPPGTEFREDGLHYSGSQGDGLKVEITDHYYPSLADKAMSLAFTIAGGSLQGDHFNLFSGLFNSGRPESTGDKEGLNISLNYNGGSFSAQWQEVGSESGVGKGEPVSLPLSLPQDITVVLNQTSSLNPEGVGNGNVYITLTLYLGREEWGNIILSEHETFPGSLYDFTLGDANSSFILKGMGKYYNDSIFNGDNLNTYFDTVGVVSIPEPSTAGLSLLGLNLLLLRRRRKPSKKPFLSR